MVLTDAAQGTLTFAVRDMSGTRAEVEVEPDQLVANLKDRIDAAWRLPRLFQQLISPSLKVLEDECKVSSIDLKEGEELTLVVSLEAARERIASMNPRRMCGALGDFSFLGKRASPSAIDILASQLGSLDCDVRRVARVSFEQMCCRDDPYAIAAACSCFESDNWRQKCGGIVVLQRMSCKGDRATIELIAPLLDDSDGRVRQEAVNSLARLAEKGDSVVLSSIGRLLGDEYFWLRLSALQAIASIAKKRDPVARALLTTCVNDQDDEIRETARQGLKKLDEQDLPQEPELPELTFEMPAAVTEFCKKVPVLMRKLATALKRPVTSAFALDPLASPFIAVSHCKLDL
mmetsp:Transcript_51707/g.138389  ORF Transcript_51707/g.138389 Transcript_51707/m.138389 type:complete len:347 (-) Transcript_51707:67-1107(-)